MKLLIIPFGGLANRIRVILSGVALAEANNLRLKIFWIKRAELNCKYEDLFTSIPNCLVTNKANNFFWRIVIKVISKYKIAIKRSSYFVLSDRFLDDNFSRGYFDVDQNKFDNLINGKLAKENIILSCRKFYNYSSSHCKLLHPIQEIFKQLESFLTENNLTNFTAFHIRYTDNKSSLDNSPIELFVDKITATLKYETKVIICTDSVIVKEKLVNIFGSKKVVFPSEIKERTNVKGMQEAFFELLILSNAKKIYGSFGSTFSLMAAELGRHNLEIVKT